MIKDKQHILLITSSYPAPTRDIRATAGGFVKDFAHELAKSSRVTVLTQNTGQITSFIPESDVNIIRFKWAATDRPLSTLRLPGDIILVSSVVFRGILSTLRLGLRNKIDFSFAFWAVPSGLWALFLKMAFGVRYAVWCLGSDIWDYGRDPFRKILLRLILKQAHTLYADGFQLKEDVQVISGKKCHFLPTSRRLPVHVPANVDIMNGKSNYLFIGRYHPNKGPDVLLEAITKLDPDIRQRVHFHFFGGGPLKESLKEFVSQRHISDVATIHGYIDEDRVAAYLKVCKALIIPSRIESIPVVLSDALQKDSPIIATAVGDMGYLLEKYRAGVVVSPESPEEMASAIERDVLREEDFAEGRKNLLDLFDVSKSVERFVSDLHRPK